MNTKPDNTTKAAGTQQNDTQASGAVKRIFDEISPTYDRLNHILSLNTDKIWRKKTVAMIKKLPDEPFDALDLCAGTFDLSLEIIKQFPNATVNAADFSKKMLEAGHHKIENYFKAGKIKPILCDCLDLPFNDNSIDLITCAFGMRNLQDLEQGMTEVHRVLKPRGQFIVLDFFRPSNNGGVLFHQTYAKHIVPFVGKLISGHDVAYRYLKDSIQGFLSTSQFKELLCQYNFIDMIHKDFLMSISSVVSADKKG
ncbi:MAG: bifunctional demethylmenaquinone methyltransferase/2-methoxy-6-polyprenyl-1,4-benzoquinol methylase UbiE [Deltaproteobacteria bacterium]|nr:bifunctional demethylmenaquinone methyltransferase/2-methoxy-6-polyprenyl-1,4-benzoquinol methylase UbiE [Deltaproteobacteria bacterium]